MAITKRSIVCGPTRRSGERYGVRTATQITPKQITAAMATPIQGEYSPNISAPRILRNSLRRLLTQLFTLKRQIVAVKQKQSSPGRTLSTGAASRVRRIAATLSGPPTLSPAATESNGCLQPRA